MVGWKEVVVPSINIKFPSLCPTCHSSKPTRTVTVYARKKDLECDIPHCDKCGQRILWRRRNVEQPFTIGLLSFVAALSLYPFSSRLASFILIVLFFIAVWVLQYCSPAVRIDELGDASTLFQFKSLPYARQFLEMNPVAFEPEGKWRWRARVFRWRGPVMRFAALYSIYLAIVMPFARARFFETVPILGIPFAIAGTWILGQLMPGRARK